MIWPLTRILIQRNIISFDDLRWIEPLAEAAGSAKDGTAQLRHMSRDRSDAIMAAYGLPGGRHEAYEIDHLIPLSIGGSDDDANLWPEPRRMIEPEWSAERKDELEMRLHALVCAGRIEIVDAQNAIAEDWTQAWLRYVHFVSLSGDPVRLNKDRNAG